MQGRVQANRSQANENGQHKQDWKGPLLSRITVVKPHEANHGYIERTEGIKRLRDIICEHIVGLTEVDRGCMGQPKARHDWLDNTDAIVKPLCYDDIL